MELQNNVINAENLNETTTLSVVQDKLRPGETMILDVGYNYFQQADKLYELLVNEGYYVRKTFVNGRNQLLVAQKDEKHQMY